MKFTFLFLHILFFQASLSASKSEILTFRHLSGNFNFSGSEMTWESIPKELLRFHDQDVQIHGFLYPAQEGCWILAAEPALKTCCIGNVNKVAQQIFVSGDFPRSSSSRAVILQGRFVVNPIKDSQGHWKQLYQLENAILIEPKKSQWTATSLALGGLCIAVATTILLVRWRIAINLTRRQSID
jgi:hypothetical protein